MIIEKVFNNNVVLVLDEDDNEVIVMGTGLGFQKKSGQKLDTNFIEKTFVLKDNKQLVEFQRVHADIPEEEINLVLAIIHHAEKELKVSLDITLYIALIDHLHYAIIRHSQGLILKNPLAWEVRKFYPTEYQLGVDALILTIEYLGVILDKDEAASIALHLVNAQKDNVLTPKSQMLSKIVTGIIEISRLNLGCSLDEDSVSYNRFRTHVQYFAQRIVNGIVEGEEDIFLYQQIQENYPNSFLITQKIKSYVEKQFDFQVGKAEQVYLTIHIQRLSNNL